MGRVSSFSQTSAQPKFYNRYKIFEPYFQDDFCTITNRLTLNLGLRVSLFGLIGTRYHSEYNFDVTRYVAGDSSVDPTTGSGHRQSLQRVFVQCGVTEGVPDGCMKGHLFNPRDELVLPGTRR